MESFCDSKSFFDFKMDILSFKILNFPCSLFTSVLQELRMAFKMFDKNRDGYIDAKELKIVTTTLGQRLTNEEVEEFMSSADLDGDGKLNYNEFVKIMTDI